MAENRLTIDIEAVMPDILKEGKIGYLKDSFLDALYHHRKQILEHFDARAEKDYRAAKTTYWEITEKKRKIDICDGIYEKETSIPNG